jgi:TonB family protein
MRQDLIFSFGLHIAIVAIMIISAPFKPRIKADYGDVIRVNLAAFPTQVQKGANLPAVLPQAKTAEPAPTPVVDSKTPSKAKAIDKPKPKKKNDKQYKSPLDKGIEDKAGVAGGQKDVSENLGAGSLFGGAAIDNASFDYPYWFVQAFNKIERNWSNPVYANQALSCVIYFQVIRSGRIISIEIEQPSGIDTFDRACEQAVKLSEPLPPLPDDFADEIIGIHLEFPYRPQ